MTLQLSNKATAAVYKALMSVKDMDQFSDEEIVIMIDVTKALREELKEGK